MTPTHLRLRFNEVAFGAKQKWRDTLMVCWRSRVDPKRTFYSFFQTRMPRIIFPPKLG